MLAYICTDYNSMTIVPCPSFFNQGKLSVTDILRCSYCLRILLVLLHTQTKNVLLFPGVLFIVQVCRSGLIELPLLPSCLPLGHISWLYFLGDMFPETLAFTQQGVSKNYKIYKYMYFLRQRMSLKVCYKGIDKKGVTSLYCN